MQNIRQLLVALLLITLAACGGGGTMDGSGGGVVTTPVFSLTLQLNQQSGVASNSLSQASPLTLTATLTATNNGNVANRLISFSLSDSGLALFNNAAGTALTNAQGIATVGVLVGTKSGAGEIIASFNPEGADTITVSSTIGFSSAGDGGDQVDVTIGSVSLIADTLQLGTGASSKVELSALVRDNNNVVLTDIPVTFASDSGELVQIDSVTGANGVAKAVLTSQTNKSNREVLVTVRVQQQSSQLTVMVVGTSIEIAAPNSVVLADTSTIDLFLTDANGIGIQGSVIEVSSALGNALSNTSPVTAGSAGKASLTYTATNSGGDILTVSALGVSNTAAINISADEFAFLAMVDSDNEVLEGDPVQEVPLSSAQEIAVEWKVNNSPPTPSAVLFNTTRGVIADSPANLATNVSSTDLTDVDGKASAFIRSQFAGLATISAVGGEGDSAVSANKVIEFIAVNPTKIETQAFPAQIGSGESSAVRAVVRDNRNNPVKNQVVVFSLDNAAGGVISTGTAQTNSQGIASTVFTADANTGAGVESENLLIRASLQVNNNIFDETDIAVGKRTLFFRFGTGNVITKPSVSTYSKEFSIIVTDSSGNPVANQALNVAVVPTGYRKGFWVVSPPAPAAFKQWVPNVTANCENEDANLNGILDVEYDADGVIIPGTGEDFNGDGQLTPGNVAVVPRTVTADESGIATFTITYPQDYGSWIDVRLQVSGFAAGTENVAFRDYMLPVAAEDVTNETSPPPANPLGTAASCAIAN